ncbi:MAG TPA: response regulator [Holophagaceae bacterium]|nr:response regulator [Holophagaceae bacterium]HJW34628.1 response regulator [Holophagaceae bacterium]
MPRLLLVDDNPSIHRIAESLLAPTAIELVCVDSAAEALERFQSGERFDVAMIDTAMPGMDGWTLLERLRSMEATARMPIAMMAGVLDPVDPVKIQNAPIQGFLKKPIELRELGDRVNALLATPVAPAAGPVTPLDLGPTATRPMTKDDLALAVEEFPEFRPTIQLPDEDLLILGPEDLWMEPEAPAAPAAAFAPVMEAGLPDLELEELDLEGLQDLAPAPAPAAFVAPAAEPVLPEPAAVVPVPEVDHELDLDLELAAEEPLSPVVPEGLPTIESPALPDLDTLGAEELGGFLDEELPVLPEARVDPFHSMAYEPEPVQLGGAVEPEAEPEIAPVAAAFEAFESPMAAPEPFAPVASVPEVPVAEPPASSPASVASVALPASDPEALVRAILANPALVEALSKAIAGSLSEKALKEVAWEVIPDLARKLHS